MDHAAEKSIAGPDPELIAKTTLHALGDLIAGCSPQNQPSADVLGHFLALYREIRGTPKGLPETLQKLLECQQKSEKALGVLAQAHLAQPGWTRS